MAEPHTVQKEPYLVEAGSGTVAWCACGRSANQPYCDGAHSKENTGLNPVVVKLEEKKTYAFCGCKRTGNPPFCDGAHNSL